MPDKREWSITLFKNWSETAIKSDRSVTQQQPVVPKGLKNTTILACCFVIGDTTRGWTNDTPKRWRTDELNDDGQMRLFNIQWHQKLKSWLTLNRWASETRRRKAKQKKSRLPSLWARLLILARFTAWRETVDPFQTAFSKLGCCSHLTFRLSPSKMLFNRDRINCRDMWGSWVHNNSAK